MQGVAAHSGACGGGQVLISQVATGRSDLLRTRRLDPLRQVLRAGLFKEAGVCAYRLRAASATWEEDGPPAECGGALSQLVRPAGSARRAGVGRHRSTTGLVLRRCSKHRAGEGFIAAAGGGNRCALLAAAARQAVGIKGWRGLGRFEHHRW